MRSSPSVGRHGSGNQSWILSHQAPRNTDMPSPYPARRHSNRPIRWCRHAFVRRSSQSLSNRFRVQSGTNLPYSSQPNQRPWWHTPSHTCSQNQYMPCKFGCLCPLWSPHCKVPNRSTSPKLPFLAWSKQCLWCAKAQPTDRPNRHSVTHSRSLRWR